MSIMTGTGAQRSDAEIEAAYNAQVAAASQAEMEAGTETAIRRMSPLRVAQAIAALAGAGGGNLRQLVFKSVGGKVSTGTAIPSDDTIPQITEGAELTSQAITPTASDSVLLIAYIGMVSADRSGGDRVSLALFVDSTANALTATATRPADTNREATVVLLHKLNAVSTSARTYRVRFGPTNTGNAYNYPVGSPDDYGGVQDFGQLVIVEIAP